MTAKRNNRGLNRHTFENILMVQMIAKLGLQFEFEYIPKASTGKKKQKKEIIF